MNRRRIAAAELTAGMVLAEDLNDDKGQRLLGRGTVLNDKLIALLQQRVAAVWVAGEAPAEDAGARDARCRALAAAIERRFRHSRGNVLMDALHAAVLAHRRRENGCDA